MAILALIPLALLINGPPAEAGPVVPRQASGALLQLLPPHDSPTDRGPRENVDEVVEEEALPSSPCRPIEAVGLASRPSDQHRSPSPHTKRGRHRPQRSPPAP